MSTAHGFLSCSNSYGWTNSCFCLISRIPIQFIQCFVGPACPAPSPRFAIGFWHADFDEAIPARMWLAQNGAQASGNTDEAGRGSGEKYGTYWIWLDLFIDVYIYIQCICAYIYIYTCVCVRMCVWMYTYNQQNTWKLDLNIENWDLLRSKEIYNTALDRWIYIYICIYIVYLHIYNPLNSNW